MRSHPSRGHFGRIAVPIGILAALTGTFAYTSSSPHRSISHGCPAGTRTEAQDGAAADACRPLGGPETIADLAARYSMEVARQAAPFDSTAPGAYDAAVAQAAQLPTTTHSWSPYAPAPLCAAPTTSSTVCPPAGAANGSYGSDPTAGSGVGKLGFRTLSGRITSFATDPANALHLWASPTAGGVFESTDGAVTWKSVGDRLPTQVVGAIAYDAPRHTLLVGTGDNSFGGDGISGHGLLLSTNDGSTWSRAAGVPDLALSFRIVVSPADPTGKTIYFASSKGLFRSTGGGTSFVNENLPTTPPGYSPNCAGNTTTPLCFFASIVSDVVVKGSKSSNAPAGAVMAVVGWRAGSRGDTNPDGSKNMSCTLNGATTQCIQAPRDGVYISSSGAPGSFTYQDQPTAPSTNGFAANRFVGRTALGIAHGAGQNNDAVYALVQDAQKFQGCLDVLDTASSPACSTTVNGETYATVLDGMYASYNFGHSWTKIMDFTQTKYPGTNSSLIGQPGYSPGVQAWYNLWVDPDPTVKDASGNPQRVAFGLEEIWENNLTVPGVLSTAYTLQPPAPAPWHVVGRYWNACTVLSTGVPCNPDLKSNPIPGTTTHPDQHASLFVPDAAGGGVTLYAGSDGGVFKQHVASGSDFTNDQWGDGQNLGLNTLQPYDAEIAKDGTVVSGAQDNGEDKIAPDGHIYEIYGGDGFYNTIDPNNSQSIIEEYTYGASSLTNDGGATWFNISPGCDSSNSLFATPIEQDPTTPGHVIEGCTQIQEATNAYANPCAVPPGAPANQCVLNNVPFTVAFDLGTAPSGQTNNIPSAIGVRGSNIYVGFCGYCDVVTGGLPFHSGIATSVGGWHIISNPLCADCGTPDGTLPQRYITSTQLDPVDPNTVYVSMGGYGRRWIPPGAIGDAVNHVGDGHLFVSHDAGVHFTNISGNLPDAPANWTVIRGGALYVATDVGVFTSSTTSPGSFSRFGTGLPASPVFTLRLSPANDALMIAATYGRGVYKVTLH